MKAVVLVTLLLAGLYREPRHIARSRVDGCPDPRRDRPVAIADGGSVLHCAHRSRGCFAGSRHRVHRRRRADRQPDPGGADEVIPQLKGLNDADPSKLEELFHPLGIWIASQRTAVAGHAASSDCTAGAVERYLEGLDRYDDIRKKFLAWRDWGALGNAFPPGAPREAGVSFRGALVELEAHCSA